MPLLDTYLSEKLAVIREKQGYRTLVPSLQEGVFIERNGKRLLSFSSNDYLGLRQHPEVVSALRSVEEAGAGASRLVTGNHPLYQEVEALLAKLKGTKYALIFGSGYLANIGVLSSIIQKDDLVLMDKNAHACMYDGVKLSSATLKRFRHNDMAHLEELLKENKAAERKWIVTETIFSMDGDAAPLKELESLANRYNAWLITDDAHGLLETKRSKADIQIGTLSKAAGVYGGYVCASKTVIDYITNTARPAIFSTGLPPCILNAVKASLNAAQEESWRRKRAVKLAQQFAKAMNLPKPNAAIVPYIIGSSEKAVEASLKLQEKGFFISAIRPPTVAPGSARLRVSFSASHTEAQVESLVKAFHDVL